MEIITGRLVLPANTMCNLRERDDGRIGQSSNDTFCGTRASLHTARFASRVCRMTLASCPGESNSVHPSVLLVSPLSIRNYVKHWYRRKSRRQ